MGKTSWRRLPGEKQNWLRPSVPLMYEEAQGRESHLKSRIAMLGETFRPIQQRKTGGAILVVLSNRGSSRVGTFQSRGGDAHTTEELCM